MLRLLRIHPGEERTAFTLLAMMVTLWSGFAIGGNAVESLLFVRFGPHVLPILFIVVGLVTAPVMLGASAVLGRGGASGPLVSIHAVMALVVLASRALLLSDALWVYPVLWIVMMVLWALGVVAGWGLAGAVSDTRQSKRLFPLYGAGMILGIVLGAAATGPLAAALGAENLLFVWAAALAATTVLARTVVRAPHPITALRRARRPAAGERVRDAARFVGGSPLLRWMAYSLTLLTLLYFALGYLFATAVSARYPTAESLAGFLGLFMSATNATALLLSLLVANRLFSRFGVITMVLALPILYLVGFAAIGVSPGFGSVVAFRFAQMVWVNGIWAGGWQALFSVVPTARRAGVRAFMDAVPLQAGVVAAGLLLLVAQRALGTAEVAAVGVVAAAAAAAAVWQARRGYMSAVAASLRAGNPEVFGTRGRPFGGAWTDAAAVEAAERALADDDPAVRRIAQDVLAEAREGGRVGEGETDASPSALDPDRARAAAGERMHAAVRLLRLRRRLRTHDERLALLAHGLDHRSLLHGRDALRAIAPLADGPAVALALENLRSEEPEQRANALEVLEWVGEPRLVRPLLRMWDDAGRVPPDEAAVVEEVLREGDVWLRACASFAVAALEDPGRRESLRRVAAADPDPLVREAADGEEGPMETLRTLSMMERALFLRKVSVFAELEPDDLRHVAEAVTEHLFEDGEVIAAEGEPGDDLHVVVTGEVRVSVGDGARELARRAAGEYVGEMALLSRAPRMASLVATGTVRTLSLDRPRFQRIVRERPEVSLAVMRVLCDRLRASYDGGS